MTADIEVRGLKVHVEGPPDEILSLLRSLGGGTKAEEDTQKSFVKEVIYFPYSISDKYPWFYPSVIYFYGGTYATPTLSSARVPSTSWQVRSDKKDDEGDEHLVPA